MTVKIHIPTPLQPLTNNQAAVEVQGKTIKEVLLELEHQFPEVRKRLYDDNGNLRRFINIYINEEDIRFLNGPDTEVNDNDEISIIPAIAGGKERFAL
ncbi:MAG: molybdopterin synthase sulfur carrier subunit [Nitrospinae bacterium RIFCSPLOWO2_12_FULL_45_22]|nr:MAG: molybdopterin synthase sulfur carrier subunit [Nitrospinae bacterium RIFCSPLOWO2_12_FULL_45_22]